MASEVVGHVNLTLSSSYVTFKNTWKAPIIEATSRQTLLSWPMPKFTIKYHIDDCCINWSIMVSVMISSNGSLFSSLDEHKGLFSTVLVHNLSLSCLV